MKCISCRIFCISIIFWFTKNFIVKLTLRLFIRYSYILGEFPWYSYIEAILIKKRVLGLITFLAKPNEPISTINALSFFTLTTIIPSQEPPALIWDNDKAVLTHYGGTCSADTNTNIPSTQTSWSNGPRNQANKQT